MERECTSSVGCASSLTGTHLKGIDLALVLCKDDNKAELSTKEKTVVKDNNLLVYVSARQLSQVVNITTVAVEAYTRPNALLSTWYRGWADFVKEEEDFSA